MYLQRTIDFSAMALEVVQYRLLFLSSLLSTNCGLLCHVHDLTGANCQIACLTHDLLTCLCVSAGSGDCGWLRWCRIPNSFGVWAFHCWFRWPQRAKVNISWSLLQIAPSVFALSMSHETGEDAATAMRKKSVTWNQARSWVTLFVIIASIASSPVLCGADGVKLCVMLKLDAAWQDVA